MFSFRIGIEFAKAATRTSHSKTLIKRIADITSRRWENFPPLRPKKMLQKPPPSLSHSFSSTSLLLSSGGRREEEEKEGVERDRFLVRLWPPLPPPPPPPYDLCLGGDGDPSLFRFPLSLSHTQGLFYLEDNRTTTHFCCTLVP